MSEKLIKFIASIFRLTPHFKGKFRIGKIIQKLFNSSEKWNEPEFFISLKNKTKLFIDVRSKTHIVPFWIGKRDQEIISKIQKYANKDSIILDVGANIGYYTIPLAYHLKKENVKIHAFEPVTSNYNSLLKGIQANNLNENVIANKIALGDKEGTLEIIKTEKGNTGNAVLSINNENFKKDSDRETIQMITLDQYMINSKLKRCDFIKIDIEGAEIFFIQGGMKLIETFKPIIYGEFNSFFINKFGFSVEDVRDLLKPLGYNTYIESSSNKAHFKKTEIKKGMENILFIPAYSEVEKLWFP